MRVTRLGSVFLAFSVMLIAGCGGGMMTPPPGPACTPAAQPAFAYVLSSHPTDEVSIDRKSVV